MARIPRKYIKISGEIAYYHIISHTVWEAQRPFTDREKRVFVSLLRKLTKGYLIDVISFVLMDNHFHLLVKVFPHFLFSQEEILSRAKRIFSQDSIKQKPVEYWMEKLSDISSFVKDLKGRFAQWYNLTTGRKGHLWHDRFKSILIGDPRALLSVAAYIELNPIRAGISKTLLDYNFTSYSSRMGGEKWLLPLNEIADGLNLEEYRRILFELGIEKKEEKAFLEHVEINGNVSWVFLYKAKGLIYGEKMFVERIGRALLTRRRRLRKVLKGIWVI